MTQIRINLLKARSHKLAKHLVNTFAQAFDCDRKETWLQVTSGSPELGEYVAEYWRSQGWQIMWYAVPKPSQGRHPVHYGDWEYLSMGFVVDSTCELYVAWCLENS